MFQNIQSLSAETKIELVKTAISILSLVTVIVGGIFAFIQWKRSQALKRADYINELNEKMRDDSALQDFVYMIDYGKSWYSKEFHKGGELEKNVDKSLAYFSYVCYLKEEKIINDKEFQFFEYRINRILQNWQIRDYFYNLYHFSKKFNVPFTFDFLFQYGKKKGMFEKDFFDNTTYKKPLSQYHRNISF